MGYRSDVGIALRSSDYEKLLAEAMKVTDFDNTWLLSFLKNPKTMETEDEAYVYIHSDWVKWYEDYPEIQFITDFLSNHRHAFIRLGEDSDDVEENIQPEDDDGVDDQFYELIFVRREIDSEGFE